MSLDVLAERRQILLIYESDREREGEALMQLLIKQGVSVFSWKTIHAHLLQPGLPLSQNYVLEKCVEQTDSYVIIPSAGLWNGQASLLISACIDQYIQKGKPVIPAKFEAGSTGSVYLDQMQEVNFFSDAQDPAKFYAHMEYQTKRLLWGLGLRGKPAI